MIPLEMTRPASSQDLRQPGNLLISGRLEGPSPSLSGTTRYANRQGTSLLSAVLDGQMWHRLLSLHVPRAMSNCEALHSEALQALGRHWNHLWVRHGPPKAHGGPSARKQPAEESAGMSCSLSAAQSFPERFVRTCSIMWTSKA